MGKLVFGIALQSQTSLFLAEEGFLSLLPREAVGCSLCQRASASGAGPSREQRADTDSPWTLPG